MNPPINTAIFCSLLCAQVLIIASGQAVETIYTGGVILTMEEDQPRAEAVAVRDGKIVAAGERAEVFKLRADTTKLVDLDGKTMLPGFVDAHGHVMGGGLQALSANLLAPPDGEVKDIATLQQTLRDWMAENRKAVEEIKLVVG
ncbi:MAG: amidohydrolase family protein, partial [Verrucomicrobiales bacterium]